MRKKWTRFVRAFSVCTIAVILSACQEDLIEKQQDAHEVGFYAGGVQTRTTMLPNGLSAVWEPGDELAVWAKNSAGEFTLQNQTFKTHGVDGGRGFFTSVLDQAMPEGTYTYLSCYPVPAAVNGTKVTFNIPALQDGKASGGVDVMIADPTEYGALTAFPVPDDHSTMKMKMNRMMHQFRFYVPEEDQLLGDEKFERIYMTFPTGVTGNVTFDVADPDASAEFSDGQTDISLELAQPIGVSKGEDYQFACLAMAPVKFEEGQKLQITKAYTDDKIAFFDPIDLKAKECLPGHSTPVKLKIKEIVDYAGIINVTLGTNNLGENPKKITLTAPDECNWGDGGSNIYVYEPGREILVGETLTFKFETDEDAYKAFSGKEISITYDSENALMSETLTMPEITVRGKTTVSMTIPYLLFEDFSCVSEEGESYGNNTYSQSERDQPGASLDNCMSHTGWNAARYWTTGNCIRINTRYQEVKVIVSFASYHYGRLDTPKLSGLKAGKTVKLDVIFDAGGNRNSESSLTVSDPAVAVATHSNSAQVIDGIPTGTKGLGSNYSTTLADFGTTHDTVPVEDNCSNNAFNDTFTTRKAVVYSANSENRLCFYVTYKPSSGTGNCEFNVYIDNIKVQIAN